MNLEDLVARHPRLFHTADARAWPSIQRHGLLPAASLLEACDAPRATEPSERRRRTAVMTMSGGEDTVVVRDQLPLKFLDEVLEEGTTAQEFLDILDSRCFLWASEERLLRLLNGRMYRGAPQVVLTLDTHSLMEVYGDIVELSPYNSGSAHVPTAPIRGKHTFLRIEDYDYDQWQRQRGRSGDAVVEVTVPAPVPDILDHLLDVSLFEDGEFHNFPT